MPAPCRGWPASGPGRLRPGPWFLTGVSAEVSGVKRDFAWTFTRPLLPVLVALRSQSRLRLEGRARTLSGPSPDLGRARILTNRFADQAVDLRLPGLPFLLVAAVLRAVADVPWVAQ
jgi:hypothetical protein